MPSLVQCPICGEKKLSDQFVVPPDAEPMCKECYDKKLKKEQN